MDWVETRIRRPESVQHMHIYLLRSSGNVFPTPIRQPLEVKYLPQVSARLRTTRAVSMRHAYTLRLNFHVGESPGLQLADHLADILVAIMDSRRLSSSIFSSPMLSIVSLLALPVLSSAHICLLNPVQRGGFNISDPGAYLQQSMAMQAAAPHAFHNA